jgi:pyrimidine 5'-nucleotidase
MNIETIFFDLDSTLYPESNGLWQAIRERIDRYMLEVMNFQPRDIPGIRQRFLEDHGTTLKGLQIHHNVDPADYLNYVHNLPLTDYLHPDPSLREMLLSIPRRRWVFTNSDSAHAKRVMDILGISDCFEDMIDVWRMDPYCKPQEAAYELALDLIGGIDPTACALLDDSPMNLATARKMGFFTVLVGENGNLLSTDRRIDFIHDLPRLVPEFWS